MVDWAMVVLRILHILGGVYWGGTAFLMVTVIEPTVQDMGAEGGKFMQRMADVGKLSTRVTAAAGITVLSGLLMYWRVSGELSPAWLQSGHGIAITVGALFALAALALGAGYTGRSVRRLGELGKQMQASGKPPSPDQLAEVKQLQERISAGGRAVAILLVVTIVGMASAQYLLF